jgi:hypothetical protein
MGGAGTGANEAFRCAGAKNVPARRLGMPTPRSHHARSTLTAMPPRHYLRGNRRGRPRQAECTCRDRCDRPETAATICKETIMHTESASNHSASIAENYVEIWNEADGARRRKLIEQVFAPQVSYTDPLMQSAGYDALNAMIAAAQAQFAGLRFSVTGRQDAHHDVLRFSWALGVGGAEPIAIGTDIAEMTPDGRIARVTGFIDKMPS